MVIRIASLVILVIVGIFLSNGCSSKQNEIEFEDEQIYTVEIDSINLYIETSASMGGYFQKDAEFKTIVSDLSAKLHNNIKPLSIWFIAEEKTKYPNEVSHFSADIATTRIADQKSSQIHKIIEEISANTDSTSVSLFVSDCILSFPDEEIRKNPEINKYEAPNALKNNIFTTFSSLKRRNLTASVYAFTSKFYGTYYDYGNRKTTLNGENRPFYIWVIGNKLLLDEFNEKLLSISTFRPDEFLHFGVSEQPVSIYEIFTQVEKSGKWSKDGNDISGLDVAAPGQTKFSLGMDLSELPFYAQSVDYLNQNLIVNCDGCQVTYSVKEKDEITEKPKGKNQLEAFARNSHFFVFEMQEMIPSSATISFQLPLKYDTWYLEWSTDDDRDVKESAGKTFGLEHLINGVREAYETNNSFFIDSSIQLTK